MQKVKAKDIVDEELCCVYCGTAIGTEFAYVGCCGEAHSATFLVLADGSMIEEDECLIIEEEEGDEDGK